MAPKAAAAVTAAVPKQSAAAADGSGGPRRGRKRTTDRPRIDIDDEIERANELATIMKKLSHAAKMEQRNATRCKARLLKKCGKVSAVDLERLAVLKRCGLMQQDPVITSSTASASAGPASSSGGAAVQTGPSVGGPAMKRIAEAMKKGKPKHVLKSMELVHAYMKGCPGQAPPEEEQETVGQARTEKSKLTAVSDDGDETGGVHETGTEEEEKMNGDERD